MKVGYLGDEYSHSYAACRRFFDSAEFVSYKTVRKVGAAAADGECDFCVLPVENSVEGAVTDTADILLRSPLFIRAETTLPIKHDLIGLDGARLEDVKTVYSHPQALAQCEKWLEENLPNASLVSTFSTSYALRLVKERGEAAVARAPRDGQVALARSIEDSKGNATRFLLLSGKKADCGARYSVVFSAENKPGGLLKALRLFESAGVNMTRIESRPSGGALGEYVFFVDFTSEKEEAAKGLLGQLKENVAFTKFLGRYDDIDRLEAETDLWD